MQRSYFISRRLARTWMTLCLAQVYGVFGDHQRNLSEISTNLMNLSFFAVYYANSRYLHFY
jgi:hypothetical protein